MQNPEFIKEEGYPNYIYRCNGFYISYNPGECETALCIPNPEKFWGTDYFILNGDWREAYKELVPSGYEACKAFFDNKREIFGSFWSD